MKKILALISLLFAASLFAWDDATLSSALDAKVVLQQAVQTSSVFSLPQGAVSNREFEIAPTKDTYGFIRIFTPNGVKVRFEKAVIATNGTALTNYHISQKTNRYGWAAYSRTAKLTVSSNLGQGEYYLNAGENIIPNRLTFLANKKYILRLINGYGTATNAQVGSIIIYTWLK